LLQHLAKHNAFHRAVENAAKDIVDRCLVAESRAGIIIAALAEFPSCLFDFDTPCRDLGDLSPYLRDLRPSSCARPDASSIELSACLPVICGLTIW
jgi:hypothetical protein